MVENQWIKVFIPFIKHTKTKIMKSPIRILKLMILLLTAVCTFAGNTNPLAKISEGGSKSFILDLKENDEKMIRVKILDRDDQVLLDQKVNTQKHQAKRYNMKNLPMGVYTLSIEDAQRIVKHDMMIVNGILRFDKKDPVTIFKPTIKISQNIIDFNLLKIDDGSTEVRLLDNSGELVYSENINETGSVQRRYNVSMLEAGKYTLSVETAGALQSETFRVSPSLVPAHLRIKSAVSTSRNSSEIILN